jgi:hypothetical protein
MDAAHRHTSAAIRVGTQRVHATWDRREPRHDLAMPPVRNSVDVASAPDSFAERTSLDVPAFNATVKQEPEWVHAWHEKLPAKR